MSPVQEIAAGRVYLGAIDQRPGGKGLVDAEGGIPWPSGVDDSNFSTFLDKLGSMFATRPSAADATIDLDESQIEQDTEFVLSHKDVATGLRSLVELRHAATIETRLNPARTAGFEAFPRYRELVQVAEHGATPHFKPGFPCNRGEGDFLRPQARLLRAAIRHQYGKLHRKGWCILLPKALVQGMEGVHISPTHVAYKRGDTKGRCCVDHTASGLNDGTDMEAIEEALGQLSLPGLKDLATLLYDAYQQGARSMFKTDVASAFNRVKLSYAAVLSQATQVDNLVLFPLVAVFGWTASPIYYSLISEAVNWAHNGGVAGHILDGWRRDQGKEVPLREIPTRHGRSCTYVDDTLGPIWPGEEKTSPTDADTIICRLLGNDGVASEKSEQGPRITGLGWYVDMVAGTMRPSDRGIQKMFWWCFRKAGSATKSMLLQDLQSLVSLLRWYSAVIPMAMGALGGLTALLGTALRARQHAQWVRLDGASQKDLEFWRWLLGVGLQQPQVWSSPFWFLADRLQDRVTHELFTDASTLIGGGYVLGTTSFGQFRWEETEKRLFASAPSELTDINVLEFVVAVLAIISEREVLRGSVVLLRVDNMSAVSWLNRLRLNHLWGQSWMRLLITVSLSFNIRVMCSHVPGVKNSIADGLSRYFQATTEKLLQAALRQRPMPTWESRERWWRSFGATEFLEEWLRIHEEPILQGTSTLPGTVTPWDGKIRI
jgi:hypothetical protein